MKELWINYLKKLCSILLILPIVVGCKTFDPIAQEARESLTIIDRQLESSDESVDKIIVRTRELLRFLPSPEMKQKLQEIIQESETIKGLNQIARDEVVVANSKVDEMSALNARLESQLIRVRRWRNIFATLFGLLLSLAIGFFFLKKIF